MEHLNTENVDIEKNGWELLSGDNKSPFFAKVGDIVKIVIVHVSPLDYEDNRNIRSVSHESLWVEVTSVKENKYIGILKTKPGHEMKIKDKTEFNIGDTIIFNKQNIQQMRNFH